MALVDIFWRMLTGPTGNPCPSELASLVFQQLLRGPRGLKVTKRSAVRIPPILQTVFNKPTCGNCQKVVGKMKNTDHKAKGRWLDSITDQVDGLKDFQLPFPNNIMYNLLERALADRNRIGTLAAVFWIRLLWSLMIKYLIMYFISPYYIHVFIHIY